MGMMVIQASPSAIVVVILFQVKQTGLMMQRTLQIIYLQGREVEE